jgi:hypothetical protein
MRPRTAVRLCVKSLVPLLMLSACVKHTQRTRLPDGSYFISCENKLAQCLGPIEELCKDWGYDVSHASERIDRSGPTLWEDTRVKTEAVVRCRRGTPLLGRSSEPWPPASASGGGADSGAASAPVPAPIVPRCVPGTTQACAGPRACTGAQACGPDGMFRPCDCGAPENATTPAHVEGATRSDAGLP